ncbi:hypothetical protein TNCV_1104681 [Trichonephila clavipes]|nr:hypothetical protein TNCV_1104681 [Trichonephila clavipes]
MRAFGDGPRNFEPWSSDVDDTQLAVGTKNDLPRREVNTESSRVALAQAHYLGSVHVATLSFRMGLFVTPSTSK